MHLEVTEATMQRTVSDPPNDMEVTDDPASVPDRFKDDMASRRISSHIPAPLRKKKTEDQYKKFITPTGNPVVYLQQHMRSKSMSDLADEKRDEESHRAEINTRYEEMEKLKVMLKEEEDTWTSHLQSWKSRRRSVTEDARKRKQERDSLEKDAEHKTGRRRVKTYKEIVQDKMKRDKELADLKDHDEYEFVSPRSSTSGTATSPTMNSAMSLDRVPVVIEKLNSGVKATTLPTRYESPRHGDAFHDDAMSVSSSTDTPVQYKYTTKLTAMINHVPSSSGSSSSELSRAEVGQPAAKGAMSRVPSAEQSRSTTTSTLTLTPMSGSRTLPRGFTHSVGDRKKALEEASKAKSPSHLRRSASPPPAVKKEVRSTIPNVLLRTKNPNSRKERPKSAHDLRSGVNPEWSSSLPRNYHDYSAPRPLASSGTSNFAQYRKTAFANRRNMWENISKPDSEDVPPEASQKPAKVPLRMNLSHEPIAARQNQKDTVTPSFLRKQGNRSQVPTNTTGYKPPPKVPLVTPVTSVTHSAITTRRQDGPTKVPLVAGSTHQSHNILHHIENPTPPSTATLSSSGLSMVSPRVSKAATLPRSGTAVEHNALFDDMKICINQRPRSEKGFGFTVRGGDDGKPVIVDTVSPGGAADICQLCVGDEILAINEVPLADCRTQDDIVQLIVSSVITGNLSLNIRRYGKVKKSSPLRLSGTKVVMTPGGFVQVRSDKVGTSQAKTPHISKFQKELSIPVPAPSLTDANNNEEFPNDFPPPPTQQELADVSMTDTDFKPRRPVSPLSGLVAAASRNSNYEDENEEYSEDSSNDSYAGDALSEVHTNRTDDNGEEELRREVLEAQKALDFEQVYEHYDQERRKEEHQLRLRLQEEQRKVEEEEAQREEARKRHLEEARLEDLRVEEELRKIQARKLEQQQRRIEFERTQAVGITASKKHVLQQRVPRANGFGKGAGETHWMIEEAERRRLAEKEGKPRANMLQYGRSVSQERQGGGGLPDHVIQRLTERSAASQRGHNPYTRDVAHFWNDPNAKATLL